MASQGLQELASLLPGGTYITFTVLAQLTTSGANMTARLMTPACDCSSKAASCDSHFVCGAGYWEMSVALLAITAAIVFVLAWYGEDLKSKKAQVVTVSEEKQQGSKEQLQQQATLRQQATLQQQTSTSSAAQTDGAAAAAAAAAGPVAETGSRLPPIPSMEESMEEQASAPHPFLAHQQQQPLLLSHLQSLPRQQQNLNPSQLRLHQSSPAAFTPPTLASRVSMPHANLSTVATAGGAAAPLTASITAAAAAAVAAAAEALPSKRLAKQAAANAKFTAKLAAMSAAELRRKYAELVIQQVIRAVGGVAIFLVLALFTPPVSTCLLPPCAMPEVVVHVVPLLVSFAVSAFVTVKDKFVHRLVFAFDWWLHPEDREPGRWSILTSGVKLGREEKAGVAAV